MRIGVALTLFKFLKFPYLFSISFVMFVPDVRRHLQVHLLAVYSIGRGEA
jgi:hypothetical protein